MFTVKGIYHGRVVTIEWDEGKLYGDDLAIQSIQVQADHGGGVTLGGLTFTEDLLGNGTSAFLVMKTVLRDVSLIKGKLPRLPKLPKDAVS
jgi:hypothetical protein